MNEQIDCPACESSNDAWNQVCEACGAQLHVGDDSDLAAGEPTASDGAGGAGDAQLDESTAAEDYGPEQAAADTGVDLFDTDDNVDQDDTDEPDFAEGYGFEIESSDAIDEDDEDDNTDAQTVESAADSQPQAEVVGDDATFDDLAADGGATVEAGAETSSVVEDNAAADNAAAEAESAPQDHAGPDNVVGLERSDSVVDADQDIAADANAPEQDVQDHVQDDVPPEVAAILNADHVDREPIEPLPEPGTYDGVATLLAVKGGRVLGEVDINTDCTVFGLSQTSEPAQLSEPAPAPEPPQASTPADEPADADEADEIAYELEVIDEPSAPVVDEDPSSADHQHADESDTDTDAPPSNLDLADSDVSEADAGDTDTADDSLDEGRTVDLSQYGDRSAFGPRHVYVFRQHKNYTLYVLSDKGTQLNDEMLALGDHRRLTDGDVVVLGGQVALQFSEPAA